MRTSHNRAAVAARAAANNRTGSHTGAGIYTGPLTHVAPSGNGARKGKTRYAGAGERGYSDAWNRTPFFKTAATVDARWSA